MKTIRKVEIEPVFTVFMPEVLEDNKLYISEEYLCAQHRCLCGCGNKVHTPIGKGWWSLEKHTDGKISLKPSIHSYQLACNSHYIISKNIANFV